MTTRSEIISSESLEAYRRTRAMATGLLLLMACLFVSALVWQQTYPWLAWLRAFAEAAMVGALADWYAVTALFKQPLGLPIPHTRIIPRNKDRIAASIGSLTQRKLVTPDAIGKLVDSWKIPEELTTMLVDPRRRQGLTQECARLLIRLLEASEDAAMHRFIRTIAAKTLRGVTVAPLLGQLLSSFLHSPERDRLVDDALELAIDYVERHRESLSRMIADKLPWSRLLSLVKLDEKVAGKFVAWVCSMLHEMRDNRDDLMRRQLVDRLKQAAHWLMHAERALEQESTIKDRLLAHDALLRFIDDSWHNLKGWLLTDLNQQRSETRDYLDAAMAGLGESLKNDISLLTFFRRNLQDLVVELATRHHDRIGELVTSTVREWSVAHMVETIEHEVGRDLQFIRINGTMVGGLAGLFLHAVSLLIDRLE